MLCVGENCLLTWWRGLSHIIPWSQLKKQCITSQSSCNIQPKKPPHVPFLNVGTHIMILCNLNPISYAMVHMHKIEDCTNMRLKLWYSLASAREKPSSSPHSFDPYTITTFNSNDCSFWWRSAMPWPSKGTRQSLKVADMDLRNDCFSSHSPVVHGLL